MWYNILTFDYCDVIILFNYYVDKQRMIIWMDMGKGVRNTTKVVDDKDVEIYKNFRIKQRK